MSVLLGKGNGAFPAAASYPVGSSLQSVADFGFGGRINGSVQVLLGKANGTFGKAVKYTAGTYPVSVAIGDFNGDGKLDLAVAKVSAGYATGSVSVLLGKGAGTFQSAVNYAVSTAPVSIAVGDFNGDGKPDLAVADGGGVSVLLGNGDGTFQPVVNYATGTTPKSVGVGDFNGDGKADLAVATEAGVSVLLGKGDGTFRAAVTYAAGPNPYAVAVADFNGDGKIDLAVANPISHGGLSLGDGVVSVLRGNGDGTFQKAVNYAAPTFPTALALGDFNDDGKPTWRQQEVTE